MLSVPKLDDLSYDKLAELARGRIPFYTGEWTDFNDHDPGITTLQALAWLVDTLNYYIDATGEEHRLKYLRLLGIKPERAAARCLVTLSADDKEICIAKGAKLAAGAAVFEVCEGYTGAANRMTALFQETGGSFADLTPFAGADGEYAVIFTYDKTQECCIYIGFERELSGEIKFYADVPPHPSRNPFEDDFRLSEIQWDYFDGISWRQARLLEDETRGFLKSGFIRLAAEDGTALAEGHPILPKAHYLRARLLKNEYDVLPRIGKIHPNCAEVVQTDTRAQTMEFVFGGNPELAIEYHTGENDVIWVAVEQDDSYSLWFEHVLDEDSLCEVVAGKHPWQRVIRFDARRFGAFPEPGQKILVTVADAEYYDKFQLGVTTGFAKEQMEVDLENLYELRLAMLDEKDGRPCYRIWEECGNIAQAAADARVFQLDRAAGVITFGDGIEGAQPEAGRRMVVITAKNSLLNLGNVRQGRIDRFLDERYQSIRVQNIKDAAGGKRPKSSSELEREIEAKIYKTTRAVTAQDYEKIVGETPGLIIDGVNVISSLDYAAFYGGTHQPHSVLIAVKPYSGYEPRSVLSEAYRRRIGAHMERYRLLTTHVRILSAKYVGVEADGRIVLTENTPALRRRTEEKLTELINLADGKKFGASLIYGHIFSRLEMLDCVSKVSELSFICYGEGARKNEQGDIVVYPDAIAYLNQINIEFA